MPSARGNSWAGRPFLHQGAGEKPNGAQTGVTRRQLGLGAGRHRFLGNSGQFNQQKVPAEGEAAGKVGPLNQLTAVRVQMFWRQWDGVRPGDHGDAGKSARRANRPGGGKGGAGFAPGPSRASRGAAGQATSGRYR